MARQEAGTAERVLVTGSAGLVGAEVARRLAGAHDVVGVDLRPSEYTGIVGDIGDPAVLRWAVRGVGVVVHTAALHAPHVGVRPDADFTAVNVRATRALLAAARAEGVHRFVLTSSTSVYGHALAPAPPESATAPVAEPVAAWVSEDLTPRPRDIYDITKLAAEELVREAAGGSLTTVTLRVARCFPEPLPVAAWHRLHRGADVRDVAQAHVLAVTAPLPGHLTCNVAGPRYFERAECGELWRDAAAVIRRRHPSIDALLVAYRVPPPARVDRVYVSDLAAAALGYAPKFGLAELLADLTGPARSAGN